MAPDTLAELICALGAQVHITHASVSAGGSSIPYSDAPAVIVAEYPAHMPAHPPVLACLPEVYRMVLMGLASMQGSFDVPEHERRALVHAIRCLDDVLGALLSALVREQLTSRPFPRAPSR